MFVARRMKKKIVTAAPSESLFEAQRKMRDHTIRQLPVVSEDGTLLGIVSDRESGPRCSPRAWCRDSRPGRRRSS